MDAVTPMLAITEEQILEYFKKKGATSAANAIKLDFEDLQSKLDTPELVTKDFSEFSYVKRTPTGKYYIDKDELKNQTKLVWQIVGIIFIIMLIPTIFGLIGFLFNW